MTTFVRMAMLVALAMPGIAGAVTLELEALAGTKELSPATHGPLARQIGAGLRLEARRTTEAATGLILEVTQASATRRGAEWGINAFTCEAAVGVRRHVGRGRIRAVVAAGPALMQTTLGIAYPSRVFHSHQTEAALWASIGLRATATPRCSAGVDLRRTESILRSARNAPSSGTHVTATLSWRFGRTP